MLRFGWMVFAVGCASHTSTSFDVERPDLRPKLVALAEPVFLNTIAPPAEEEVLWDGSYVGNILFSGGFEVVEREGGLENVSVEVALSQQERYTSQFADVVGGCVREAMGTQGKHWVAADLQEAPPVPTRRNVRGTEKLDGRDNQPLPRFELTPGAWDSAPSLPTGTDALLVPYVIHYYAHNGGWFIGQTYGSAGGARARVFWVLYGPDGRPSGWGDHQARTEDHGKFSPNSQEIQDYLIDVEEGVCKTLRRKLP